LQPDPPLPERLDDHPEIPDDFDGYSDRWTGTYLGLSAFAGPAWMGTGAVELETGWCLGVAARLNIMMTFLDIQFDYRFSNYDTRLNPNEVVVTDPNRTDVNVQVHALTNVISVHPLFLNNLKGSRFQQLLASLRVQGGLSLLNAGVSAPAEGTDEQKWALGLVFGAGFDLAITHPGNASGVGVWLEFLYRYSASQLKIAPLRNENLAEHMLTLGLSLRNNGLIF